MYQRLAEARGWRWEVVDASPPSSADIASWWREISGKGVFAALKFESGVHRVAGAGDRVSGGRIHTSAATVAVLPEAEEVDIDVPPQDIRIDTMRASGAGGQHVNTTRFGGADHPPADRHRGDLLGEVAAPEPGAGDAGAARRLYDLERGRHDAARAADRKGQVGAGDRSEQIRTYNFPQARLTDHRIGLTLYKLDQVMQGDLDEVLAALATADQAARLADLEA